MLITPRAPPPPTARRLSLPSSHRHGDRRRAADGRLLRQLVALLLDLLVGPDLLALLAQVGDALLDLLELRLGDLLLGALLLDLVAKGVELVLLGERGRLGGLLLAFLRAFSA